jgi:hypothetical protein
MSVNPWITHVPLTGPIEPDHQPYLGARHEDGKYVLLKEFEVKLTEEINLPIGHAYMLGGGSEVRTDGVSIPRLLWTTVGMQLGARCRLAGFVHDFLYRHCGKVYVEKDGELVEHTFTRLECDKFFYDHLVRAGIWRFRAWTAYRAVRLWCGGGAAWRAHAKRIASERAATPE